MGLTRSWAFSAVAPWCLATGLLISFAADAGQGRATGFTALEASRTQVPSDLVPSADGLVFDALYRQASASAGLVSSASLFVGSHQDLVELPDEVEPRMDLKREAVAFPVVDRSQKGNLDLGLRPGYQSKLPPPGNLADMRKAAAFFGFDERNPPAVVMTGDADAPAPDTVTSFEGFADAPARNAELSGLRSAARGAILAQPQRLIADLRPPRHREAVVVIPPALPRALAAAAVKAASLTPALPRMVAFLEPSRHPRPAIVPVIYAGGAGSSVFAGDGSVAEHPDYLALVSTDKMRTEAQCLAEAVYFEARSEPDAGQAAVAQVVLNRLASGLYSNSVCGVVYQNRQHYLGCQFSFACEGKSLRITEPAAWATAQRIANEVLGGATYVSEVGDATHYHAKYVRPYWAASLTRTDIIGQHVFYGPKRPL